MKRRRTATPAEVDDAIAAFNAMVDIWEPRGWIPLEEVGSELPDGSPYPIYLYEAPRGRARTLLFQVLDGRVFDLRLKGRNLGGDVVVAERLGPSDVRRAFVVESNVTSPGHPDEWVFAD